MAIPFKDGGRDFFGVDCMGYYMLILAREAKIGIEDVGVSFGRDTRAVMRKVESELHSGNWIKIAEGDGAAVKALAGKFDAVLMSAHVRAGGGIRKSDLHIGCALGNGFVTHIEEGSGAQYVALDDA